MEELRPIEPEDTYITETHSSPEPMRQPVFECKMESSEEAYRNLLCIGAFRRITVMSILYIILGGALLAVAIILNKKVELYHIIPIVFLFAWSILYYFVYKSSIKRELKRIEYANDGKFPPLVDYFFEDEIVDVDKNPDKTKSVRYEDVKSLRETDVLYLLEVKYKLALLIPKDIKSISNVSFEEFIKSKVTGIKRKKSLYEKKYKILSTVFLILLGLLAAASVVLYFVIK